MRVQTKLMLSTFPIFLGGFVLLTLLSFYTAEKVMRADAYRYIGAVLESRTHHTLGHRAELLRTSKMDKVASFVELYKQEALDELAAGSEASYGCFAVFEKTGAKAFASPGCDEAELLAHLRRSALAARAAHKVQSHGVVRGQTKRLFGVRYFAPWGWTLAYSTEASRLEQAADRMLAVTFGVASLCVAACALVVVLLFRRVFAEPVLRLKAAAARIARREPNVALEVRSDDELGALSESLNEMAKAISEYIRELEQLRADLERSNTAMALEIAQRREAQTKLEELHENLRKNEDSLSRAVNAGNVGLWDWDVRTGQADLSSVWKRQLGYGEHELAPRYEEWESRLHPADLHQTIAALKASSTFPWPPYETEFRLRHKDGSYRWILATGAVELDDEKRPVRMRGVHIDITERKRAEEERLKLEARLSQAQKMESVGRLAGGVAHDFNNLLGVILMRSELLLMERTLPAKLRGDVNEILKAAERSAELTKQLLAFARKQTAAPKVLDLNESVTATLKLLQRLIGENISLVWTPAPNLWAIRMDPSQVSQILTNLCVNARDAIVDVGTIAISTSNVRFDGDGAAHAGGAPGDYVQLAVRDDGQGMDAQTQAHIFEPFFTTKKVGEGTGLGLATVHGIVEQNQGFITVHSELGRGTTFQVHLPRCLESAERDSAQVGQAPLCGHETILLVEDERALLTATIEMLERLGYTVLPASSATEALQLAQANAGKIQLLLTDVVMPDMNGKDLAAKLLALYPELKCVFMSGYSADVIKIQGVAGQLRYVDKPFDIHKLSLTLREALG